MVSITSYCVRDCKTDDLAIRYRIWLFTSLPKFVKSSLLLGIISIEYWEKSDIYYIIDDSEVLRIKASVYFLVIMSKDYLLKSIIKSLRKQRIFIFDYSTERILIKTPTEITLRV